MDNTYKGFLEMTDTEMDRTLTRALAQCVQTSRTGNDMISLRFDDGSAIHYFEYGEYRSLEFSPASIFGSSVEFYVPRPIPEFDIWSL